MRIALRQARLAKRLTQAQLASAVGVTRPFITSIEHGRYTPGLLVAARIAQALGGTIDDLFFPDERTVSDAHGDRGGPGPESGPQYDVRLM